MTTNSQPCHCSSCPGAACTCGCQNVQAKNQAPRCACGDNCKCGPECSCKQP